MRYYDIPSDLVGCIRLISFLVCAMTIYSIVRLIVQKQKKSVIAASAVLFAADYLFFHLQLEYSITADSSETHYPPPASQTSLILILLILAVLIILSALLLIYCGKWEKTHLTTMSVKECLDNLPVGICYCNEAGRIVLINNRMNDFLREIRQHDGIDPVANYEKLKRSGENDPVFEMSDGSIVILRRNETDGSNGRSIEYLALDITKKYRMTQTLEEENRKLKAKGDELRRQGKAIDEVILNREILDTKIRVHNNLGQILLSSRYVLTHDTDEKTKSEIVKKWLDMSLLRQEETKSQSHTSSIDDINRAAMAIGVEIVYSDRLPDCLSFEHISVLEHMLHEALTNSYSHAHADKLFVSFKETEESVVIEITNNGIRPERKIVEGGGLSSLRKMIENKKGKMEISEKPEFKLKVSLKK